MGSPIRIDQTVHTEITVMYGLAKIPSIEIRGSSVYRLAHTDSVIAPFPHKSSAHPVVIVDQLKIVFQIPGTVAHRVAILNQKKRLTSILFKILLNLGNIWIHSTVQIQVGIIIGHIIISVSCAFIVGDSPWIKVFGPSQSLLKIASVCAFIAHGPHKNTGPVPVPYHHALHPIQNGLLPRRIVGNGFIPSLKPVGICVFSVIDHVRSMGFDIRLIHDHEPISVTQLIKIWRVRIMAGADGIEIMLFHHGKILFKLLHTNGKSSNRIRIMTIHSMYLYLLTIQIQNLVLYFNGTKTHKIGDGFLLCLDHKGVQIGGFRTPPIRSIYRQ